MRKLATFALSFAAAVFSAQYFLPMRIVPYIGCAVLVAALVNRFFPEKQRFRVVLICVGFAFGSIWYSIYAERFITPAEKLAGGEHEIEACVLDYPDCYEDSSRVLVRIETKNGRRIRAYLYTDEVQCEYFPGDRLNLNAYLKLSNILDGEEYDYYLTKRIYLLAYANGDIVYTPRKRLPLDRVPTVVRHFVTERMAMIFDKDSVGLAVALLSSDSSYIMDADRVDMQRAGIYHIAVVSGMHVALLLKMIQYLGLNFGAQTLVSGITLLIFMIFTGGSPPVMRAGILQMIALLGSAFGRGSDNVTSVSFTLMLLLMFNPFSVASVGLQLSFAASVGIIFFGDFFYQGIYSRMPRDGRYARQFSAAIASALSSTVSATVCTLPILVISFGYVSLVAPLTNLLCSFAVSFTFIGDMIAALIGIIYVPFGAIAAKVVSVPIYYILGCAHITSKLKYSCLYMTDIFPRIWICFAYVLICVSVGLSMLKKGPRPWIVISALSVTLALSIFVSKTVYSGDSLNITVLDVGQGQCIVLSCGDKTVMIDCGGSYAKSPAETASDYVNSYSDGVIDLLVLTHLHTDHAGHVADLMARTEVRCIAMPTENFDDEKCETLRSEIEAAAEIYGTDIAYITEETEYNISECRLTLFPPVGSDEVNERGIFALCSFGDYDAVITGDADIMTENRFVTSYELPDIELLIVGHHGSAYSTGELMLQRLKPEYAVISVGYNSYGHPSEETVERLTDAGVTVYRTDINGSVTFTVD